MDEAKLTAKLLSLESMLERARIVLRSHSHSGADGSLKMSLDTPEYSVKTVTADYTAAGDDCVILANATSGSITVSLPQSSLSNKKVLFVKKTDSSGNSVTIDGYDSETIDGSTTKSTTTQYATYMIVCDGSNWHII